MGYQEKNNEESRAKSSEGRSLSRRRSSPLSKRISSPRSSSLRNKSVSPRRSSYTKENYCRFHEEEGDLFTAPLSSSLAHCVSSDMKMSAGIAVHFRRKFGHVEDLLSQGKRVGEVAYLKDGRRYIFYLVTKNRFHDRPTEDSLRKSLVEMKQLCHKLSVKKLAMPRIGCGLDGLEWFSVSSIIQNVFSGSGISITIYSIERRTPWNKSAASHFFNRKEHSNLSKSEPSVKYGEHMKRKRSGSCEGSKSTPKRPRNETPIPKPSITVKSSMAKATSSTISVSKPRRLSEKSQWETESSSSNESGKMCRASNLKRPLSQRTLSKQDFSPSKGEDINISSLKLANRRKNPQPLSLSSSSDGDESDGKNNDSNRRVESLVSKPVKAADTLSEVPLEHITPKIPEIKSPKNMSSTWSTSSGSESPPTMVGRKFSATFKQTIKRQGSSNNDTFILKRNESLNIERKRKFSGSSPLQSPRKKEDCHKAMPSPGRSASPHEKKKRIYSTCSYYPSHKEKNLLSDEVLSSKSKNAGLKASNHQTSDDQPLETKQVFTRHLNYDFLSASDVDSDDYVHENDNESSNLKQNVGNKRIFILDSPGRQQRKGLSRSMKGRLGLPVTNQRRTSEHEQEETVETPFLCVDVNSHSRKSTQPVRGTMYCDRESSKLSAKERLSLGSRIGR